MAMRARLILRFAALSLTALTALSPIACGGSSGDAANDDAGNDGAPFDAGSESTNADALDDASDGAPDATPEEQAAFTKLLADAQTYLDKSGTPGASIAVVLHGKLTFAAGIGKKNVASGEAVTTSTLFRAASMSKMVVAATAMTVVEEGKLDLDAPITNYLSWFTLKGGADASGVTTARLLSHSSGFPCDTVGFCYGATNGKRSTYFQGNPQPLWAPPGLVYDYSNAGFALAATVVEAAEGSGDGSYEQLAHDRILAPVGMSTATFDAKAARSGDHATGYVLDASGKVTSVQEPTALECPMLHPPGGVNATASDYAHFAEMLIAKGGTVLKPDSVAKMEAAHVDMHTFASQEYGFGLISQSTPYPDHPIVWHDGALPGFLSETIVVPDLGVAIIAMVNGSGGSSDPADAIAVDGISLFVPEKFTNPTLKTPASAWSGYVGTYDDAYGTLGTGVVVSLTGATLSMNAPNATDYSGAPSPVTGALTQIAIDTWEMPDGTGVTFFPDATGTTTYFATRRGIAIKK
jgi:CubicO group peptidase (beta-lactamase class C family)